MNMYVLRLFFHKKVATFMLKVLSYQCMMNVKFFVHILLIVIPNPLVEFLVFRDPF